MSTIVTPGEGVNRTSAPGLITRIPEPDGLLGLAILLVIVFHYFGGADPHFSFWLSHILGALSIGWSGVDLRWLGGMSYCLYMIHLALNFLAHGLLLHSTPQVYNLRVLAVTILALLATLSVASLSWPYFEKPLLRRGRVYSYDRTAA